MGQRGYPPEFRRKMLDLVDAGRSVADVARDLGISDQSIYTWRRQDRIDCGLVPHRQRQGPQVLRRRTPRPKTASSRQDAFRSMSRNSSRTASSTASSLTAKVTLGLVVHAGGLPVRRTDRGQFGVWSPSCM